MMTGFAMALLSSRKSAQFPPSTRNHGLITGWRILGLLSIPMKDMVGTGGLEPQTSTVSIPER
jgi:hypothetical protein